MGFDEGSDDRCDERMRREVEWECEMTVEGRRGGVCGEHERSVQGWAEGGGMARLQAGIIWLRERGRGR